MSNGVLSFTLGLETSNFLRNLGVASGGVISFAAAFQAIRKTAGGVWDTIGSGGKLQDLANRTGASVKDLYQLRAGFDSVGLSADLVSPMILRLRQALGGVDEEGNRTDKVFEALGLNMEQLAKSNPAAQLTLIAEALNKAGGNKADALAKGLFGREGAGNMMQLARDSKEFNQTLHDTAAAGTKMQSAAKTFDDIGDALQRIKNTHIPGMMLDLAVKAGPAIKWVVDKLEETFRNGNFATLVVESFQFAFQAVLEIAPAVFAKLGSIILNELRTPLVALQSFLEYFLTKPFENAFKWLSALDAWAKGGLVAAVADYAKSERYGISFDEIFARNMEIGPRFNLGTGEFGLEDIDQASSEALRKALKKIGARIPKLDTNFDPINPSENKEKEQQKSGTEADQAGSLVKMGFITAYGSRTENLLQRIADNTAGLRNGRRSGGTSGLTGLDTVS